MNVSMLKIPTLPSLTENRGKVCLRILLDEGLLMAQETKPSTIIDVWGILEDDWIYQNSL